MSIRMTALLHRSLSSELPTVVRGEGPYLFDSDGKRYFDGSCGAAVSCLGHSHPRVVEAIRQQVGTVAYAHTSFFTNEPAERLATHLVDRAPDGFGAGRAMFVGSGSEAVEAALKLTRQYWIEQNKPARSRIIARDMAYHGNTLGALAVGGHKARRAPYAPMLMSVGRIPACYPYRLQETGESDEAFGLRMAETLRTEIEQQGPETVAAFIAEPISGATLGCVPPAPGYFRRIREICDEYGILFIADEVMCGMGRTGTLFAMEQEDVCPDIIIIAKGLGAGFQPIAGVMARESVIDVIRDGSGALANGHTYMGHAVSCAGSLAALEVIEEEGLLARVREMGDYLRAGLEARFGQHANVGDIRGKGLFQAMEFVADRETKKPFPKEFNLAGRFKQTALANGLVTYPSAGCADGVLGDHLLLAPPYISTREQIDDMIDICDKVLRDCLSEGPGK
jgi:adenosylmethionine-8-amino-7-oxononanoate aminotransferase